MIIRCTKCSTEFALDPSQVGPEGVTLRCSVCSHMFHAEPDPEAIPAPWKVLTADRHQISLPDLRRVLEQLEDGRLKPEDQLSHTGTAWIRLGEMPEFSSLFIGAPGLPRVFKAIEAAAVPDVHHHRHDEGDVRREETVRVRVQNVLGSRRDEPLPAPPDYGALPESAAQPASHGPTTQLAPRHHTQEFVSPGARGGDLPAPPDYGARPDLSPRPDLAPRPVTGEFGPRPVTGEFGPRQPAGPRGHGPLVGGPIAAESGALPAPPDYSHEPRRTSESRPAKKPASMLEAVTNVVAGDVEGVPETEANRSRSAPILVADLARAAAAHAEKTVQAVDSQRAREKAARNESSLAQAPMNESSTGGRAATAAAVSAAMAIARESTREPARTGATERSPIESPRVTERFPAERPSVERGEPRERSLAEPRPQTLGTIPPTAPSATPTIPPPGTPIPTPEPSTSQLGPEAVVAPPRPPEVVIVKVGETNKGGSGVLVALLGIAAAAAIVFGVPSIRERVFNLGQPTPVTKAEPSKAQTPAMPTEEFKAARAAIRSLGLKETNKAQTALQKIIDDPKRPPAAVAQAKQLLAELLLERALACQIAVTLEASAMSGEAQARSTEDPPAARELLESLGADAPPDADAQRHITALEALVAGQSPAVAADDAELSALVRAAPLWRGQIKTPPSGLISTLQRLPNASTLSQSVLALAYVRSGDEASAREQLLGILKNVSDQPVARTLLDLLDRQGMMTEAGDPEVATPPVDDPPVVTPPTPSEPGKPARPTPTGTPAPAGGNTASAIENMVSTGCQKVRAGDPEGVKLLLAAIERGARPTGNFNLCFCLGNGFARQNAHDTAFTWYSRAVEQSPTNRDAVAGAARSAELLGRTSTAVEYYKKLRALEPTNSAANAYLGKHDSSAPPPQTDPDPGDDVPPELMGVPTRKKTP
ncbi:MAG: zinc-ribbon domain-containing protein [Myxococcales bacterium]|nr:zinc-ribbon domain-containing protein [Myxococcales bacterium]